MEQGSNEWVRARLGKVTASRITDVVARTKSGWGASRANYMAALISERLTGLPSDMYTSPAMIHGTETEPLARAAYEFYTGRDVEQVGLIDHPTIAMCGASPDGLVGADGLVEIKCPNIATHIDTLLAGVSPPKYRDQMLWQMECTGRAWCEFVSFDPRMPEDMRFFCVRVERDEKRLAQLREGVIGFLAELDAKLAELTAKYSTRDAA